MLFFVFRIDQSLLKKKQVSIDLQLDSALKLQIQDNRSKLSTIIETIIFYGRQNISLRGFRDFELLDFKDSIKNDGNFCVLLRLRV